ncbi:MAG: helix-turn-helix domain-containing protein [Victivallales bacterium]|nr:helix-turn-helix domain-containing protein [Victivallales bacterium]
MKKPRNPEYTKSIVSYTVSDDFSLVCRKTLHSDEKNTPKEHEHKDFYELVMVSSGRGIHRIGQHEWEITPGNVFLIPPHQSHCYVMYENLEIYNLLFTRKFVRNFLSDLSGLPGFQLLFNLSAKEATQNRTDGIRLQEEFFPEVISILDEMDNLNNDLLPGNRTLLLSDFLRVMLLFSSHCHWAGPSRQINHIELLTRLLSELEKNISDEWPLKKMAGKVFMSISSFRQNFRKLTGRPPTEYFTRLRLAKAARLLESSMIPLDDITQSCGFHDSNFFARQFKKYYHALPARYRRECQAGQRAPIIDVQ